MTSTKSTKSTKSTDEKAAEDEQKLAEVAAKAEQENIEKAPAAATNAEAEARAAAEVREKEQLARIEETRKAATEEPKDFGGQALSNDYFTVSTSDTLGRESLEIKPTGWVGPGFVVAGSRVGKLKELLGQIKHLPKQD